MTRHSMIQPQAAGVQPPAPDPRVSMVIIVVDGVKTSPVPGWQHRAKVHRSGLFASIPALHDRGPAIADISRKLKSP